MKCSKAEELGWWGCAGNCGGGGADRAGDGRETTKRGRWIQDLPKDGEEGSREV